MANWFLIYDKAPLSASQNMARDEYLFQLCQEIKIGFFRLYSWEKPSFSFGVSQKITKAVNTEFIEKNNYSYVRRLTGGKTVLHNHEITYSVASSEDIFYKDNDLYRSYMLISNVLVDAFHKLGIEAYLSAGSTPQLSKSNNPCFSFPTPNEIEIAGKKIIGSAQKRNNKALIQHGSIPLSMDFRLYADGSNSRAAIIERSMTTLSAVSSKTGKELAGALIESFQAFIGQKIEEFTFESKDKQAIATIEEKYRSHDWNYRL
ncbi:MAG: lipoate--protein ligase family protein [bacterium]|nr:lipoate--protein ligase family protein [bacterium]